MLISHPPAKRKIFVAYGLLFLATASLAWSRSPAFDQGNAAYERNDFQTAVTDFRKATLDNPKDALTYWKLGLALRKTGDNNSALMAWDSARSIDPKLGFASSPQKFNDLYAKTAQKAGRKITSVRASAPTSTLDPVGQIIVPALKKSDAYVEPSMLNSADQAKLDALAKSYRPKTVKIAVMLNVPGDRDQFAEFLSSYLGISDGLMIVASQSGVGAYARAVDRGRIKSIVSASVPEFGKSYYDGAKYIADQTVGNHGGSPMNWILIIAAIGGVAAIIYFQVTGQKRHIQTLNRDIGARLTALQEEFHNFDMEAASASDSPLLQEAKQIRSAAIDPFAAAGEAFNDAATVQEYLDADRMTIQAEKLTARARIRLDQALGKRAMDDSANAAHIPIPADVPLDDRGACFFCSKPARLERLQPLQINISGRLQRVLACEDCYEVAKTGKQPKILTIPNDLGNREPWYQNRRYDPWNDYGRIGSYGGGGFNLMDYLLLDNLLDQGRRNNSTTIFVQDPGYSDRYARDAAGASFADSTRIQPESGEGDFFGTGFEAPGDSPERGEGDFNRDES